MDFSYVLPIRQDAVEDDLTSYVRWLALRAEVVVVDGSPPAVFAAHAELWQGLVRHVSPAIVTPNGKVGGVVTGLRLASHEKVIIADDDVRYDESGLQRMIHLLGDADVVRPQNYFSPLPWHALWDTSRSLLNRISGGDWPGTFGVRRSLLIQTDGYAGDVLFENLEMLRTIRAAGGREMQALDLFVARRPPTTHHFWSQRVRQAYDDFARPRRLLFWLLVGPLGGLAVWFGGVRAIAAVLGTLVGLAEAGRWWKNGQAVFPWQASLFAPMWIGERAIGIWLAVGSWLIHGGVTYRGGILRRAATPQHVLDRRFLALRQQRALHGTAQLEHSDPSHRCS